MTMGFSSIILVSFVLTVLVHENIGYDWTDNNNDDSLDNDNQQSLLDLEESEEDANIQEEALRRYKRSSNSSNISIVQEGQHIIVSIFLIFSASPWNDTLIDLAIVSGKSGAVGLGDWYDMTLSLTIPQTSDSSDLTILLSGTEPSTKTSSVHICSPTLTKAVIETKY